jgi:hypothetical protein
LNLPAQILARGRVELFREPAGDRANANLNLHIVGNASTRRRIQDYEKSSGANIGMGPQRGDARSHALIFKERKGGPIVRYRGRQAEQQKSEYFHPAREIPRISMG